MAFLCLTGVPYFLCATNILSPMPDGGVIRGHEKLAPVDTRH